MRKNNDVKKRKTKISVKRKANRLSAISFLNADDEADDEADDDKKRCFASHIFF